MSNDASLAAIHAAIPHRPPMLLVDQIVEQSPSELFVVRRFPQMSTSCRDTFQASHSFLVSFFVRERTAIRSNTHCLAHSSW